jgi:hypothetical protein
MIAHDAALMLAAGAALDDLEPAERDAYDAHLAGCRACAVAADELALVLSDLALVVPERLPPPDLLAGIRLAIDAEERRAKAAPPTVPRLMPAPRPVERVPTGHRRPRWAVATIGLAAALAIVAVGLGARSTTLQSDLERSQATVQQLRDEMGGQGAILAAALDPGHVTVALHPEAAAPDAKATVVYVPGSTAAWIVARGLPPTSAGTGYQLWYADDAGVHGLQTVTYDGSGPFVAPLGVDLARSAAVMLTLEPTGGATGDPGPQVVFGEL